jgi:type II secretory pathway pseudopilin PulG
LVEIIVALGVMLTVMVAVLPQLVVGLRSAGTARLVTQAKGVAQGELERMRGMPYNVGPSAGPYVDVLDIYYPDLTPPTATPACVGTSGAFNQPQTSWTGYVPSGGARCSYEPQNGALYRSVRPAVSAPGLGPFVVVTASQFLSAAVPPVAATPPAGYNTLHDATDVPPEPQIGVTVTVLRSEHGKLRPITTYTQIHRRDSNVERLHVEANLKAVEVRSVTADGGPLAFSAGQLNLVGSLSNAVTVSANLTATSASRSSGVQQSGATAAVVAPPSATLATANGAAGSLGGGCTYACWGNTMLGPIAVTAKDGYPTAGSRIAPLQTMVTGSTNSGFSVGNSDQSEYLSKLELLPNAQPVSVDTTTQRPSGLSPTTCAAGSGGTQDSYVTASGYLQTQAASVESCAVARTSTISLFPTNSAPKGVVRIELQNASANCRLDSKVASSSFGYAATVQYWNDTIRQYVSVPIIKGALNPLALVPLSTQVGGGRTLGDYIESWSSLTDAQVTSVKTAGEVSVTLPSVVSITTKPVRTDPTAPDGVDPSSALSLGIGATSCSAKDSR